MKGVQYSDMPKAPGVNSDKMAETMVRLQDIEEAFHEAITELHAMQAELVPYINQLQDPADKAIMRLRYLKGYTLDAITESADIHMERTTVYRKINEAERYITKLATSGT